MATTYQPKGIWELTQKVILDGSEQVLISDGFQAKRASISDVLADAGLSQADRTKLNSAVTAAQMNSAVDAAKTQLEQSIASGLATKANTTDLNQKADVSSLSAYATTTAVSDLAKKVDQKADVTALAPLATTQALTTLATTVANKIDATALTPYATKAYVDQKVGTAFDPSVLEPLATKEALEELKTVVAGKAARTDLTSLATKGELQTLATTVSGKADASALATLATKEDVDNVSQQLRQKADVVALNGYATTGALATVQTALDAKADAATLNSAIQNITTLQLVQATKANTSDLAALATKDDVNQADERIKADLAKKVDAEEGKGLSTNDFTNALKAKLENMASGAGGSASLDDVKATVESEVKKSIGALNLDSRFSGKADVTELANYVTTTDFNGYKTEVTAALGEKATTIQVQSAVAGLISEAAADGKYVLKADLATLKTEVEGKATAADITAALKSKLETINTSNLMGLVGPSGGWDARTKVVDNVADPVAPAHAANKRYVDTAVGKIDLSGYVQKEAGKGLSEANFTNAILNEHNTVVGALRNRVVMSRGTAMGAPYDAENRNIERVLAPTLDLHAANKAYVDTAVAGLNLSRFVLKDGNKGLSTNDFTTEYRNQLTSLNNHLDGMVALRRTTAASAAFDAGERRITGLAAPDRPADAATKAYVDSAVGTGLTKASVGPNIGLWDAKNLRIVNVPTPTQNTDVANKAYVDGKINFSGTPLTYSSTTIVTQAGGISGLIKNVTDGVRFQGATLAETNDGHTVNDNVVLTAGRLRDVISPVTAVGATTAATFANAAALRVTKTIDASGRAIYGNLVIDSSVDNRKNNSDPVSWGQMRTLWVPTGNDIHAPKHTYFRFNAGLSATNVRYNKDTGYGFISSETNPAMSNKNLFTAFQDIPPLVRWMFSAFGFKTITTTPTADRTDNKQGTVGGGFWNTPPGGSISGFQLPSWLGGWAVFGGHISNVPTNLLVDVAWPVSGVTNSWCVMNPFAGHANYFATVHPSKFMRFIIKNAYNNGEASQRISVFFLAVVKAST